MLRLVLLAATIVTLSSCYQKDDYTCTCKAANAIVEEKPYVNVTEKFAKKKCEELHDSYQPPAGTQYLVYTECTLSK